MGTKSCQEGFGPVPKSLGGVLRVFCECGDLSSPLSLLLHSWENKVAIFNLARHSKRNTRKTCPHSGRRTVCPRLFSLRPHHQSEDEQPLCRRDSGGVFLGRCGWPIPSSSSPTIVTSSSIEKLRRTPGKKAGNLIRSCHPTFPCSPPSLHQCIQGPHVVRVDTCQMPPGRIKLIRVGTDQLPQHRSHPVPSAGGQFQLDQRWQIHVS